MFIHGSDNWPHFRWDNALIDSLHLQAMHRLGHLAGRMAAIDFDSRMAATVEALSNDVVASGKIEGIKLDMDEVRSSVARRFGVALKQSKEPTHYVDGIVEMMLDATHNPD